ncbi:MAG: sugar transferase [Candidatus Pacebacteria bacterium]|nr:sugar transferase [Candidatus Paceibacterota bacterium]
MIKRLFDIKFSIIGLLLSFPLLLIISFLIKKESPGPAFYRGERVGKAGKVFRIFKFRSMVLNADKIGGPSTSADDPRLLKIGKFIKSHNLDELPQLINILKGEMSFVGPRPEVPSEVATYDEETKGIILSVKPGMTDLATLSNVHEGEILKGAKDPHEAYRRLIQPQKLKLAKEYVRTRSFWLDIKIILKTIKSAII